MVAPSLQWIDTPELLAAAAASWSRCDALGIDTEFVRERTFYPRLGLIQISDSQGAHLVDPIALPDLSPLEGLLRDPRIVKVAHSCNEDMEVLYHRFGAFPRPLFDTQIAAALAGLESSMSYQRLVAELLGEEVATGETRSDWTQRPLSSAQLTYAASDVKGLLPLYRRLRGELEGRGRLDWVLEESARLEEASRFLPEPEQAYLRLKAGDLGPRQLGALQTLAAGRELQARKRDLPRSFVLRDATLIALARRQPATLEELATTPELHHRQAQRHGELLLSLLRQARRRPDAELPQPAPQLPRREWVKAVLGRMQELVTRLAGELEIPAPLLASRRDTRELLLHLLLEGEERPPAPFDGWRWRVLREPVTVLLEEARRDGALPARAMVG